MQYLLMNFTKEICKVWRFPDFEKLIPPTENRSGTKTNAKTDFEKHSGQYETILRLVHG